MTAAIDIVNQALQLCGARSIITSMTEPNPEGQQSTLWYETDRLWLLREHRWNFARAQGSLTLIATAPGVDQEPATNLPWPFMPWAYAYAYPVDCVQFRSIIPTWNMSPMQPSALAYPQPPVPFVVSSNLGLDGYTAKQIFTNQPQAVGIWTKNVSDPNLFDSQFVEAFAFLLASHLAVGLAGNMNLANAMFAKAKEVIAAAAAKDGNEGLKVVNNIPDWLRIRGYGADFIGNYGPWGWGLNGNGDQGWWGI